MSLLREVAATPKERRVGGQDAAAGGAGEQERFLAEAFAHYSARRYAEALRIVNHVLAANPGAHKALYARGSILFAWGRTHEALAAYKRALAAGVDHADLHLYLGRSYFLAGDTKQAEACMRKAIDLEPDKWEGHYSLATLLRAGKRLEEATAECERAQELSPEGVDCYIELADCALDRNDPVLAEAHARRAIEADGNRCRAWTSLGVALERQERYDEALAALEQAHRLDFETSDVDSFYNVAISLGDSGKVHQALALLEANLAQRPGVLACNGYALTLLTAGKLREGLYHSDFRWLLEQYVFTRPKFQRPTWYGQDLRGKTILLLSEQGMGDTIQFLRYIPYLKAAGATVLLRVQPALYELVQEFPGVDRVIVREGGDYAFDFYIHLMGLPQVFGTDVSSIPAHVPYLDPDPAAAERWAARMRATTELKVGLVWAGNPAHLRDKYRSIPFASLAPILAVKGARFFLMQKGPANVLPASVPSGVDAVDLGPELKHFGDTAAAISQLDLLICVDTSVAHLAGALGKPVWLLLPSPPDWRWRLEGDSTPWYPTMRLFRQTRRNQWDDVIVRVTKALTDLVQNRVLPAVPRTDAAAALRPPEPALPRLRAGHRLGLTAVAECRYGIFQYFPDQALVGDSLGWYGEYQQGQLELLLRLMRPGATVLEAGAGIGAHALALARAAGPEGDVLAYESKPVVRRALQHNVAANEAHNVTVMRRQLARDLGSGNGMAPSRPLMKSVEAETPDDAIFETVDDLQLERLHLLKINQGVDDDVSLVAGAADTLWRLRPLIFSEVRDESALADATTRSRDYGYRCWKVETPLFNPSNYNRREDDIFAGRKTLALLAIPEEAKANIALEGCTEL